MEVVWFVARIVELLSVSTSYTHPQHHKVLIPIVYCRLVRWRGFSVALVLCVSCMCLYMCISACMWVLGFIRCDALMMRFVCDCS